MKTSYMISERDMAPRASENNATRIPVVLALDTSASMGQNGRYESLNDGVRAFYETCRNDDINRYGFDVAIVTFGGAGGVEVYQDFRPIWNQGAVPSFERPTVKNGTPLGEAVDVSLSLLERHRAEYRARRVSHTRRGFLLVITDGVSTEVHPQTETPESRKVFESAALRARKMAADNALEMVPVGVGSSNYGFLSHFTVDGKVLTTDSFSCFELLFEALSSSVSSSVDQREASGPAESLVERMVAYAKDEGIEGLRVEEFVVDNS